MQGGAGRAAASFVTALALCFVLAPMAAQAQPASQITPPTLRPAIERGVGIALPGTPGLETPAGAESLFVRLSGVTVEGGLPQLAAAAAELQQRLMGRQVSGAEIFAAARDLEAAYGRAGYVLVRVVLPPQTLVNGSRLRLVVIDGFIERVELKDIPERIRARVARLVQPLVGRRSITLREIERGVMLAADTPGAILRSTLAPGKAAGATVLVLEAKHQPVSAIFTYDNTLAKALKRNAAGAGVDFNSVMGLGELVYLRASGNPEDGRNGFADRFPTNRLLAGGFVLPLWIDGLSLNAEYADARVTPRATAGVQTTDVFERLSVRLRYAWLRGRSANLASEVSLDVQDETQSLFVAGSPVPLFEDRLRVVRIASEGDVTTPWGALVTARVVGSFGVDGLGARTAADATPLLPLSRQGANATFEKLDATVTYAQRLHEYLAMALSARAQTSFGDPLLRSEQIGIANTSALSAFDAGTIAGDAGYVVRGELSSPWTLPLPAESALSVTLAPYVFGAYGEVVLENPTALEPGSIVAASYGAGLRIWGLRLGTLANGSLTLEYGRATRRDGVAAGDRFTAVSAFRF